MEQNKNKSKFESRKKTLDVETKIIATIVLLALFLVLSTQLISAINITNTPEGVETLSNNHINKTIIINSKLLKDIIKLVKNDVFL